MSSVAQNGPLLEIPDPSTPFVLSGRTNYAQDDIIVPAHFLFASIKRILENDKLPPAIEGAMPQFSTAWFDDNIEHWSKELAEFAGRPGLRFLEVGCFEGRATRWMLEHILTHPTATIDVIDTFQGSPEHEEAVYAGAIPHLRQTFEGNIAEYRKQVIIHPGMSHEVLPEFQHLVSVFDFIYIDASHHQDDVYRDAVLCWPLLKSGGIMAFDDYRWSWKDPVTGEVQAPRIGVDRFLNEHVGDYALLNRRWQLHLRKRPTGKAEHWLLKIRWSAIGSRFPLRKSQFVRLLKKILHR